MSLKTAIASVDATPIKNVYLSIIADYDLKTAICELIDNSIDAWRASHRVDALQIKIEIDEDQQTIKITDNAGGVPLKDLKVLVSPGASLGPEIDRPIGAFGVGSKRAVVALAELIWITTRYKAEVTHRLEYDDEWIHDPTSDWSVPAFTVSDIQEGSTIIELNKLRIKVGEPQIDLLKRHLSRVYALILDDENIWLEVNGELIEPQKFEAWSFPPEFPPAAVLKRIPSKFGEVLVTTKYGLMVDPSTESWEYGVYVYCNRRLIAADLRSQEVGFVSGQAGIEHNAMNLARIEIAFEGPAELMPWNSRKDAVNYNHQTFQAVKDDLVQAVTNTAKWSKALRPDYAQKVQPFTQGEIEMSELLGESIRTRLPSPPKLRKDYKETIISANQGLKRDKPYVRGLYEGVIAAENISRMKPLTQRNRIAWIILDSTVEIALKEYLVYEDPNTIGVEALKNITRQGLHDKVAQNILTGDPIWGRFTWCYNQRNLLVHQKADVGFSDEDLEQFKHDVKRLLTVAFGVNFV